MNALETIIFRDPDLLLVGTALIRAAQKAQELALKTSTPCYIWEDGQIVNIGAPLPLEKLSTVDLKHAKPI